MLYMVIERYLAGPAPVYARAAARGRMLPAGLAYVSSWVAAGDMDRGRHHGHFPDRSGRLFDFGSGGQATTAS